MKIKVFKFQVSNAAYGQSGSCESYTWYQNLKGQEVSPEQIETTINTFCQGKEIIDIKINNVDINYILGNALDFNILKEAGIENQ